MITPVPYRPCWLCASAINPHAPSTSAAAGVHIHVTKPSGVESVEYAHDLCLGLHRVAGRRPEYAGRLSLIERIS